jgi:queuine/archaeosine tRNA-ribosyltransferase
MLGPQLASIHNLTHYLSLMSAIRTEIEGGGFQSLYNTIKKRWAALDLHALA